MLTHVVQFISRGTGQPVYVDPRAVTGVTGDDVTGVLLLGGESLVVDEGVNTILHVLGWTHP